MSDFWNNKRVLVTGSTGFMGKNVVALLHQTSCEIFAPPRSEFDLSEQGDVRRMFTAIKPDLVFHLAGLVGGIWPNRERPAEFTYQNLIINTIVFHEAWLAGVKKFVTAIGGCSYPHSALSPITEDQLWEGPAQLESAPYSHAKRMVPVLSESYRKQYGFNSIVLVPGNAYGPYDNYSLMEAHVIPALIRKVIEAKERGDKEIVMWGSGKPTRDFVFIEDVAKAFIYAAEAYNQSDIINISSGREITIRELVKLVVRIAGFDGGVHWDVSKPEGQLRKGFSVQKMHDALHFDCPTSLEEGLKHTVKWFMENREQARL